MSSIKSFAFSEKFFLGLFVLVSLLSPVLMGLGSTKVFLAVASVSFCLYIFCTLESKFRFYFIFFIFARFHFDIDTRIQQVNIMSYILMCYYILNQTNSQSVRQFNKEKLPLPSK